MKVNFATTAYPTFRADNKSPINKPSEDKNKTNKYGQKPEEDKKYSKKQIYTMLAGSAIFSSILTMTIVRPRRVGSILYENQQLQKSINALRTEVSNLTKQVETAQESNKAVQNTLNNTRTRLNEIIDSKQTPAEYLKGLMDKFTAKMESKELDYDPMNPPVIGKSDFVPDPGALPLPAWAKTKNRAEMTEIKVPPLSENGAFHIELPTSSEMRISKAKTRDFEPKQNVRTTLTEVYADAVNWDSDKVARDILQNFFDGHGQTLDGVIVDIVPQNGKYKVKIAGKSTYSFDKAIYLGETTKQDDARAAGNFGEGLKMCALKLLKSNGADNVKFASDNWKLTYSLQPGELTDKKVLTYSLDKVQSQYNGNYMEFETDNSDLVDAFRRSINRFYHNGNPSFKCPDFENDFVAVKMLDANESGGIYIAGQKFEYESGYDNLKGAIFHFKEKPSKNVLDVSRDRTTLDKYDMTRLGCWLGSTSKLSNDERLTILQVLKDKWMYSKFYDMTPTGNFMEGFLSALQSKDLKIKFPDKYVAFSSATDDVVAELNSAGYLVCKEGFAKLGMPTIRNIIGEARAHDAIAPTEIQTKKLILLKEALKSLSGGLENTHFSADELNAKIYVFDNKSLREQKLYKTTDAEAIVDGAVSKGFWIDKTYLDNNEFSHLLETALHELSHKVGGDESAAFSYKLTNVNQEALDLIVNDSDVRSKIQVLGQLWNKL